MGLLAAGPDARVSVGVSFANGVASAGGLGLGVLVSAALVELLPAPRVLPFVALLALFAIALAGVWRMPEPVAARSRPRLEPQRPNVPPAIRGPFLLAALGAVSSWSIAGLFRSLGPQLSADLFHTTNHLVAGVGVFALSGAAAVAQLVLGRTPPWAGAAGGSLALSAGMLLIVIAASAGSGVLYLASSSTPWACDRRSRSSAAPSRRSRWSRRSRHGALARRRSGRITDWLSKRRADTMAARAEPRHARRAGRAAPFASRT